MAKKVYKKKQKPVKEIDELKNQLARALADYDNLRKRVDKEREETVKLSSITLFAKMIPVFDMLFQAQKHLNDEGLKHVINELEKILQEEGIIEVRAEKGQEFDATVHEAIELEDAKDKDDEGRISAVLLKGWRLKDDVIIRPAKVRVFKNKG